MPLLLISANDSRLCQAAAELAQQILDRRGRTDITLSTAPADTEVPLTAGHLILPDTPADLAATVTAWLDSLIPTVGGMERVDAPRLAAIEAACFAHPWSAAALAEEADNPAARFFTAGVKGQLAGYAGMHIGGDEGFIANVAVNPAFRRQGVGKALLLALLRQGRQESLYRLTLEVRLSNAPAIALYQSLGFTCDGVRPGFYRDPAEDAAIYSYYYEKEAIQ